MDKTPQLPPNIKSQLPPNNVRYIYAEGDEAGLELRKSWNIPLAKYMYVLAERVKVETCELDENDQPNWDKITKTEYKWQTHPQHIGDEEWGKKTAEHFNLPFPTEEYVPTEEDF